MRQDCNPHSWHASSATYVNQVPELTKRPMNKRSQSKNRSLKPQFRVCERFICTDLRNGSSTTGIIFPSGKVYVGDDVWRLSNKADCCDYPYRGYKNRKLAEQDYEFREAASSFLTYYGEINERRCQACV